MKETTLLKVALICSIVGLAALFFASQNIEYTDYEAPLLNKNAGDDVKLTGTITKISDREEVYFVEINQANPLTVVIFKNGQNVTLSSGDRIEILGEVQDYKGEEEIIARRIRIIR